MKLMKHTNHNYSFILLFITLLMFSNLAKTYGKNETPLDIDAFVVLLDMDRFDNEKQELHVDFVVHLIWKNIKPLHPQGSDTLNVNLDNIRKIQILNEVNLVRKGDITKILPDGRISLLIRYVGTVDQNLVFRNFPFDKQVFKINALLPHEKNYRFRLLSNKNKIVGNLSIPDWKVENYSLEPLEVTVND